MLARNSHAFAALRFALARIGAVLVPINFMLNADEAAYILRHAGAQLLAVDSGLAALGRDAAARDTRVQRLLWLPSEAPSAAPEGMHLRFDALAAARAAAPEPDIGRDDLAADRLHQRHRVAAQGRDAHARRGDRPVRELHRRRRDGRRAIACCTRCRSTTARSSTCSSARAIYLGATSVDHRRSPRPTTCCRCCEQHRHQRRSSRRRRCGSRCCARRCSTRTRPVALTQGLLRRLDHAGRGAARAAASGCRTCGCGTSTARPRSRRWPRCSSPKSSCASPARPAGRRSTSRRASSTTRCATSRAGEVGEIVHRSPQLLLGLLQRSDERTAAAFEGGWFHSRRPRRRSTTRATSPSSTARRT